MGRLLRLLLILGLLGMASACTEIILKDPCHGDAVISGRTLSFPTSLTPRLAWVAKGTDLPLLDVAPGVPSPLGRTYKAKYSFATLHLARNEFKTLYPKDEQINNPKFLWSIDGMNEAGLSVAVLYQPESKSMAPYDKNSPKKDAVNFLDLPSFAMARFGSVTKLGDYLRKECQVPWSSTYDRFGFLLSHSLGPKNPTLHITFHDVSGGSLVVQWKGGVMEVLDNPKGVFTNNPLLQEQYSNYNKWMANMLKVPSGAVGPKAWNFPGDYSGASRFTRMVMAKEAALGQCWSNRSIIWDEYEILNPGYVYPSFPKSNPTIMAVIGIINTVYLPRGVTDTGTREIDSTMPEFTPFSSIRDHKAAVFYYRSANNPQYKAIDMKKVKWGDIKGGVASVPMQLPNQLWFIDYSNEFLDSKEEPPKPVALPAASG